MKRSVFEHDEVGSSSSGTSNEMSPLKKSLSTNVHVASRTTEESCDEVPVDKLSTFQKQAIWLRMQKYKRESNLYQSVIYSILPTVNFMSFMMDSTQDPGFVKEFELFLQQSNRSELANVFKQFFDALNSTKHNNSICQDTPDHSVTTNSLQEKIMIQEKLLAELENKYHSLARHADHDKLKTPVKSDQPIQENPSNSTIAKSAEELDMLKSTLQSRTEDFDALTDKYKKALMEIEDLRLKEAEIREEENFEYANLVKSQKNQISYLYDKIASLDKTVEKLNGELDIVYEKRKKAREQYEFELVEKEKYFQHLLSQLENDNYRLKKDRDSAREYFDSYKSKNEQLFKAKSELEKNNELLNVALTSLKNENSSYKKKLEILTSETPLPDDLLRAIRQEQEYADELESVAKAFEEMSKSVSKFNTKLSAKDEQIAVLLNEKSKLELAYSALFKEKESLGSKFAQEMAYTKEQHALAETKVNALSNQIISLEKDLASKDLHIESSKRRISELSLQLNDISYRLESLKQKHDSFLSTFPLNTAELQENCIAKKRLEEDLAICRKRLAAYQSSPASVGKEVLEELDICKKLLKCSTCSLRQKEVVLVKCMHVFCKQCIDTRLETRQRKCPTCLEPFGANDVRTIYL